MGGWGIKKGVLIGCGVSGLWNSEINVSNFRTTETDLGDMKAYV